MKKVLEHKETPFPEDLEGRLNAILNVVNTELKNLTLLHLDDTPVSDSEIRARIRKSTDRKTYLPISKVFQAYCHQTLFPIGAVAEELVLDEESGKTVNCYKITEAGKKYGIPIAVFTLIYVAANKRSMFNLLGSTNTRGRTRGPFNRVKILEVLKSGSFRLIDLERRVGLPMGDVRDHLDALSKLGFVEYETSGGVESRKFPYTWTGNVDLGQITPEKKCPVLTRQVAEKLRELREADAHAVSRILGHRSLNTVFGILGGLERQGAIRRKKWKGIEFEFDVVILERGRKFLEEYIDKVKDALGDGKSLEEISSLVKQLGEANLREYAKTAISLYKGVSPRINARPFEETTEEIVRYLRKNPGKRPVDICRELRLSGMSAYLTPLVRAGILRKIKEGIKVRYYVNR